MDYIIVTVRINNTETDIKIPSYITPGNLISILAEITGDAFSGSRIQAEPIGRVLDNSKALYAQDIDNGAMLTVI